MNKCISQYLTKYHFIILIYYLKMFSKLLTMTIFPITGRNGLPQFNILPSPVVNCDNNYSSRLSSYSISGRQKKEEINCSLMASY